MTRKRQPCGTRAGYLRHRRKDEPVDRSCRSANARYFRKWRADRKTDDALRAKAQRAAVRKLVERHAVEYRGLLLAELAALARPE